jgi:hypothetical protein
MVGVFNPWPPFDCVGNLNMKVVMRLIGLVTLLAAAGCEYDHEHHHHYQGGAYDHYNDGYGRGGGYDGTYQGSPYYSNPQPDYRYRY